MFPPLYVLKGYQDRFRRSLELDVSEEWVTLSNNGWMDEIIIIKYLSWVKVAVDDVPMALVIDAYKAHNAPRVRYKAERLVIEIISVPRSFTGWYQSLDCLLFGLSKKLANGCGRRKLMGIQR
jgi:hypothetical protein